MNSDRWSPEYFFDNRFKISIPNRIEWENGFNPISHEDVTMFTDGSKTDLGTGAGVYSDAPLVQMSSSLGKYSSITQAETFGIINACSVLKEQNHTGAKIVICTDSQACLKALRSNCLSSKLMIECLHKVNEIALQNDLTLMWVPGHQGVIGNEEADELARKGSNVTFIGPEPAFGLSYNVQKTVIRNFYSKKHHWMWNSHNGCKHSKIFISSPSNKFTRYLLNCSKTALRNLTSIITGHCRLRKHMQIMGLRTTGTCRKCEEEQETPAHLIMECPTLIWHRLTTFGAPFLSQDQLLYIDIEKIHSFSKKFIEVLFEE